MAGKVAQTRAKNARPKYIAKDEFSKNYNASLSLLRLERKDEAIHFINDNIKNDTQRYHYYMNRVMDFDKDKKGIISMDERGRIYHCLTNFPRTLKRFLNLRYQLDIHNSHPLMVNVYLMKYYNISNDVLFNILNKIDYKIDIYNHNDCKQLCKELKYNELWRDSIKDVPCDVLLYIYTTSKGMFWDILSDMTQVDRDEIKGNCFREIYYGHNKTTRGKAFAKKFVELYPHVWTVIRKLKKADENLPCTMMRDEAQLMREILTQLYECGFKVASIHDAVIVLDDEANKDFRVDAAVNLMAEIYKKHGLFPSIDVKDYKEGQ